MRVYRLISDDLNPMPSMDLPCNPDLYVSHTHPVMAIILAIGNDLDYKTHKLWCCATVGAVELQKPTEENGEVYSHNLVLVRKMPMPTIKPEQLLIVALECMNKLHHNQKLKKWSKKWVSGKDRSIESLDSISQYYKSVTSHTWEQWKTIAKDKTTAYMINNAILNIFTAVSLYSDTPRYSLGHAASAIYFMGTVLTGNTVLAIVDSVIEMPKPRFMR